MFLSQGMELGAMCHKERAIEIIIVKIITLEKLMCAAGKT